MARQWWQTEDMERRQWLNRTQPQTLQIGVLLLYLNAALSILLGAFLVPVALVLAVAQAAGAYGIANERKWGYLTGVISAVALLAVPLLSGGGLFGFGLLNLMFDIALIALLLHRQSREYQRIWFK